MPDDEGVCVDVMVGLQDGDEDVVSLGLADDDLERVRELDDVAENDMDVDCDCDCVHIDDSVELALPEDVPVRLGEAVPLIV